MGFTYDFETKSKYYFGAEFLYEQRGYKNELIDLDENGNPTGRKFAIPVRYNYFALPLKLGYNIGKKFFGNTSIGICPALLQKATLSVPLFSDNSTPVRTYRGDTTVALKNPSKFDFSALVEIGCGYIISNRYTVVTTFRYQYSFTSITNENFFLIDTYLKHYGITLFLGIKYRLNSKQYTETIPVNK